MIHLFFIHFMYLYSAKNQFSILNYPQMILIADSGSTKTAWKLITSSGMVKSVNTSGFNPFFRTEDEIFQEMEKLLKPETGTEIRQIYFYGSGIVNAEKGEIIKKAMCRIYPDAAIETYSDVLGAARALFGDEAGIACILGTGSNVCSYDGENITGGVSPLGYILGDEGSGAVMGRKLLGDYFKEVMPSELRQKFSVKYKLSREEALNRVYRSEKPNQFLAQFTPFLSENIENEYCQKFVKQNFTDFFERNVNKLPESQNIPIGFIGSVAFHFSQILKETADQFGFDRIIIRKAPIDGLEEYHANRK